MAVMLGFCMEKQMAMRKRTDKPCEGCGALMVDVPEKRRFCDACRLARNADNSARWRAQQALTAGSAPKPREGRHASAPRASVAAALTLDYVAMQATNEGISYGGYSVKHGLYEKHI